MTNTVQLLAAVLLCCSGPVAGAAEIVVGTAPDALARAIEAAAPGDVLRLGDASIPSPYGPYTARDLPDLPFLISGRSVYTNVAPAFMEFIPTDLDPSKFSVRFERAFVASLAAAMAYKVTGDRALVKDLQTEAAALVAQMAADDANDDNEILNPLPAGIAARL